MATTLKTPAMVIRAKADRANDSEMCVRPTPLRVLQASLAVCGLPDVHVHVHVHARANVRCE